MNLVIETERPIALDSEDHIHPLGALDQQGHEGREFFKELGIKFSHIKSVLDLGTGTGTFVANGVVDGFDVYGIEGTDKVDLTPPWVQYKDQRLFHADLRHPFRIFYPDVYYRQGVRTVDFFVPFDLITSFDVLEHMTQESINTVMENIAKHLTVGGYFMGTIEFTEDDNVGYHTLCRPREWWLNKFAEYGFVDKGFDPIIQKARHSPEENCFLLQKEI